jgi:dienelactone hydrolase
MLVLLYGNQGADENPTWMVDLRTRPELRGYVLVAPALGGDDYRWDAPAAANGVARLVESIVGRFPIDPGRITLLGYSAGGSRVLSVARRVERPVSVVSVAGDIGRAVRAGLDVRGLEDRPVLLVCNSEDHGPNASCELDERNAHLLGRRGFTSVERRRRVGDHRFDMRELAPLVAAWLEPDTTGAPAAPPSRATKRAAPIGDP